MGKARGSYPAEYRARMVELVRSGRTPHSLAKEFEVSAPSIRHWVRQAEQVESGQAGEAGLSENEEIRRLRRELERVKLEREILAKATAWFARETGSIPSGGSSS